MTTEEIVAVAYNRGLRPKLVRDLVGARVEWSGGRPSAALARVLALPAHAAELVRLVEAGFTPAVGGPPTVGTDDAFVYKRQFFPDGTDYYPDRREPLPGVPPFDREAEHAVGCLYSAGVGLIPRTRYCVNGEPVVEFECRVGGGFSRRAALLQIDAVRPLRDRIVNHVAARPTGEWTGDKWDRFDPHGGSHGLEFRVRLWPDGHHLRVWRELWPAKDVRHPFMAPLGTRFDAWRFSGETHWRRPWGVWTTGDDGRTPVWRAHGL